MTAAAVLASRNAINVDAPASLPPVDSILTVANVIPEPDEYWLNGAQVRYPTSGTCQPEVRAEPCFYDSTDGGGALADKLDASGYTGLTSDGAAPFLVYLPVRCTTRGVRDEEFRQRATAHFSALEHFGAEKVLWQGIAGTAAQFLSDSTHLTAAIGAAITPVAALVKLEAAAAAMSRRGVIHTTPQVATVWAANRLLERGPDGKLRTMVGTIVLPGQGYTAGTNDGDAFVTGAVDVRRSDVFIPSSQAESVDRVHNDLVYRVERYYLIVLDRACGVTAARIDLTAV